MSNTAVLAVRIITDASRATAGLRSASGEVQTIGGRIKSGMGKVALAVGGAFAADKIKDFAMESITAASDLSETMSKTQQIFGDSGDAIVDWSKDSSNALGLSQREALDAADTFAIFGKSAGLSGDSLTDFSKSLTGTATDFASFANTTPQEAIDAIGAALRGETEPIRKYGLMLNDATIKNEAMRLGLIKTTKVPIDPSKRALAVKSLIDKFAKGQKITGDFARTSGGLANQQRILAAKTENLKAALGQKLLPIMLTVVKALQQMGTFIQKNQNWLIPLAAAIGVVTAALKVAMVVQKLFNITLMTNPIFLIITAVIALGVALVVAYKKCKTFRDIVNAVFRGIATAATAVWTAIRVAFGGIVKAVQAVIDWFLNSKIAAVIFAPWRIAIGAIKAFVKGGFAGVLDYFKGLLTSLGKIMGKVFDVLTSPFVTIGRTIGRALLDVYNSITGAFTGTWTWVYNNVVLKIAHGFGNIGAAITRGLSNVYKSITGAFKGTWTWVYNNVVLRIGRGFSKVGAAIGRGLSNVFRSITGAFKGTWTWVSTNVVGKIGHGFSNVGAAIARGLSSVYRSITGAFTGTWTWVSQNVVGKISSGFSNVGEHITNALSDVFDAITQPFKDAWNWIKDNIISPLKNTWNSVANKVNGVSLSLTVPSNAITKALHLAGKGWTWKPPFKLPTFAQGAYVDRATLGVFGERGPEFVAPDSLLRSLIRDELKAMQPSMIVNVTGALDPDAVARQIDRIMTSRVRRTSGVQRSGTRTVA